LTDEVIDRIKFYLKENENKRLNGLSKQQKKKKDIHEALINEGFNISYPSVAQAISKIERTEKEAYIRQEYNLGDVVEFDWGTVKIYTEGDVLREYQMAVFTSAYGNFRWARLFPKQDTYCFLEAHALFFESIKGVYKTVVYDNTRVAIKKFIGRYEKEPTEALLKLSLYYKFDFRFCNIYSGNEKGHVERSVEFVRRKAFANKDHFSSMNEANDYLQEVCTNLNSLPQSSHNNKTALQMLEEEREYLLPQMPLYETARVEDLRVDKYSTISIDSCHYSVPDAYVNCIVRCKIYSSKIIVFYEKEKIAEHIKRQGNNQWEIKIEHYLKTLFRKPAALINSTALKQADNSLKEIYDNYYKAREKDFVELIQLIGEIGIDEVKRGIEILRNICPTDISTDKIKYICNRSNDIEFYREYFKQKQNDIIDHSKDILNIYSKMLSEYNS
jgi:hypothetical protein